MHYERSQTGCISFSIHNCVRCCEKALAVLLAVEDWCLSKWPPPPEDEDEDVGKGDPLLDKW